MQRDNALERLNFLDAEQKTFEGTLAKLAKEKEEQSTTYEDTIEDLTRQLTEEKTKYAEAMLSLSNQLEGFQRSMSPPHASPKEQAKPNAKSGKHGKEEKTNSNTYKRTNLDLESPPQMKEKMVVEKDPFRAKFDAGRPKEKAAYQSIERFFENEVGDWNAKLGLVVSLIVRTVAMRWILARLTQ